jgi:hypothetical protein
MVRYATRPGHPDTAPDQTVLTGDRWGHYPDKGIEPDVLIHSEEAHPDTGVPWAVPAIVFAQIFGTLPLQGEKLEIPSIR